MKVPERRMTMGWMCTFQAVVYRFSPDWTARQMVTYTDELCQEAWGPHPADMTEEEDGGDE